MANNLEKQIQFVSKIVGIIASWAKLNNYEPDNVMQEVCVFLERFRKYSTLQDYTPTFSEIIRALDDEALAEFIIDNIKENIANYDDSGIGITSPLGGYIEMNCSDAAELTEILKREVDL